MPKSLRVKSAVRRPLADVTNGAAAAGRSCRKATPAHGDDEGGLDRLLLVRSDLANLVGQIDELVAQAIEHKTAKKKRCKDIDSFRHVLSDMHSSLKVWFSRLEQTLATASTASQKHFGQSLDTKTVPCATGNKDVVSDRETELESIVSPSPLVSWRAGACTVDCGRQLFLLTPLSKPKVYASRFPESSKPLIKKLNGDQFNHHQLSFLSTNGNNICEHVSRITEVDPTPTNDVCDNVSGITEVNPPPNNARSPSSYEKKHGSAEKGFFSPLNFSIHKSRRISVHLLTPFVSKSSALCDPLLEPLQPKGSNGLKLAEDTVDAKGSNHPKSEEVSEGLTSKYQDFLALQVASKLTTRRKEVDETLNWFLSPPKTCVLMEPSDEKSLPTPANSRLCFGTPTWKDIRSSFNCKQPGEATLKRELWTKFDAVSSSGLHFDVSVFQKTGQKGFIDMLEEVSCENAGSDSTVAR